MSRKDSVFVYKEPLSFQWLVVSLIQTIMCLLSRLSV